MPSGLTDPKPGQWPALPANNPLVIPPEPARVSVGWAARPRRDWLTWLTGRLDPDYGLHDVPLIVETGKPARRDVLAGISGATSEHCGKLRT